MCLILFAAGAHPRYPLIVAANRDESYSRASAAAAFWADHPLICAGRDLEYGGTWLGLARNGRFAAVTNYRQGGPRAEVERSRGDLALEYLAGNDTPATYLQAVAARSEAYNGFSLIVGNPGELWFYSNRGAAARRIAPGAHGLSNHLLDEPWPKVQRGVAELESLLAADDDELTARLLALLAERRPAPDDVLPSTGIALERERALSASFVAGLEYGTRASTVVLVRSDGLASFRERTYGPAGTLTGETDKRFRVERTLSQAQSARARS